MPKFSTYVNVNSSVNVEIYFEVYCAICGEGICGSTEVKGKKIYVQCPKCQRKYRSISSDQITELQNYILKLLKERETYPSIPEFQQLRKMGIIYK